MKWIAATDLEQWADRQDARSVLPELICRLIRASADQIDGIRFPSGGSVNFAGWDGHLLCSGEVRPFVPAGSSVWELTTMKDIPTKIIGDFEKRSGPDGRILPAGFEQQSTSYIAVSLRRWHEPIKKEERSRDGFIENARSRGIWKDIRVIDADDLELWLEQQPSVAAWLARDIKVGQIPSTVFTIGEVWHFWKHLSEPPINENLLLEGRTDEMNALIEALTQKTRCIHIKADSLNEAQAFVIAAAQALPPEDPRRFYILSKMIIVKDERTAIQLPTAVSRHIIIIVSESAKNCAGGLAAKGHTVVVPLGNSDRGKTPEIVLRRPSRASFARGLEAIGMSSDEAELLAKQCCSSITVFQRRKPSASPQLPSWATTDKLKLLIPAILAGAWSERSEADKSVLINLSGKKYDEFTEDLHQFLSVDEPPIALVGDVWSLIAPADAFTLSERLITPQYLTRLEKSVKTVFSEIDPKIDMDPKDRPFAAIFSKNLEHSSWIRDGLAQTLLLVAVIGSELFFPKRESQQTFVDNLVKELPGLKTNARLLISLRDQLPVLVEAAPDPFVEALEALLQGDSEIAQFLFADKDSAPFGDCRHAGILWALEGLAWDPVWLPRASILLIKLAEIDPGGTYTNRPMNSLREIFLPWHPGTNANLNQRIDVIDLIIKRFPQMAWKLLANLLPSFQSFATRTHEPQWRESGRSQKKILTRGIVADTYDAILSRTLDLVGNNVERWKVIIDSVSNFSPEHRNKCYGLLESICHSDLSANDSNTLWNLLRKHLNMHKEFQDAKWALPNTELVQIEKLVALLEPSDLNVRFKWLFDDYLPRLPINTSDHKAHMAEVKSLRAQAILEIIRNNRISGLLDFISMVAYPGMAAEPVLDCISEIDELLTILELAIALPGQSVQIFATFLSATAFAKYGQIWSDKLLASAKTKKWNDDAIVTAIQNWPDSMDTFSLVASLGDRIDKLYWSKRPSWLQTDAPDLCAYMIEKLISANRALDAVELADHCSGLIESALLVRVLDNALEEINSGVQLRHALDYHIDQILIVLKSRSDVSRDEVARKEYAYLPLLFHYGEKKNLVLHDVLAENPELFIKVICDIFKPASDEQAEENLDDNKKIRAEIGYQLLESWQVVPGSASDGSINLDYLRNWTLRARELAAQQDRTVITDQEIGKLLAYSLVDAEDKAWPHKSVRNLLEELANDQIERGLMIEDFNKRGVYSKAVYEGGKQERQLASERLAWADTVGVRWPRTSALLRKIAEDWELHAKREDDRAEQDRLKYE